MTRAERDILRRLVDAARREKEGEPQSPSCGTIYGHRKLKCRCVACRAVYNAARRRRYHNDLERNRELTRNKHRNWRAKLKEDPAAYRKYLDRNVLYLRKARERKRVQKRSERKVTESV